MHQCARSRHLESENIRLKCKGHVTKNASHATAKMQCHDVAKNGDRLQIRQDWLIPSSFVPKLKGIGRAYGFCSARCCVFRKAFGCCAHPKAGRNLFFSRFSTFFVHFKAFLFISKLFQ